MGLSSVQMGIERFRALIAKRLTFDTEIVPAFNQGNHPSPCAPLRRELLITAVNDAAAAQPDGRRVSDILLGRYSYKANQCASRALCTLLSDCVIPWTYDT